MMEFTELFEEWFNLYRLKDDPEHTTIDGYTNDEFYENLRAAEENLNNLFKIISDNQKSLSLKNNNI